MKTFLFLLSMFFFITLGYAQESDSTAIPEECVLLEKGINFYQQEEKDSAIYYWRIIVENYPDTHQCYANAFNNIPLIYADLEQYDSALVWFDKILGSKLNDFLPGDNIMEPYANYHHNACMKKGLLLSEMGQPAAALQHLGLAETDYKYETFSCTSFEKRAVSIATIKAAIYWESDKKDSAVWVGVQKILDNNVFYRKTDCASYTNVDFYSSLIKSTVEQIEELYGAEKFKNDLLLAIQKMKFSNSTIMSEGKKIKARLATFELYGKTYSIGITNSKTKLKDLQKSIKEGYLVKTLDN